MQIVSCVEIDWLTMNGQSVSEKRSANEDGKIIALFVTRSILKKYPLLDTIELPRQN